MTSFSKALYRRDPAAAEAFRRHSRLDRIVYGKTPTLACFTLDSHPSIPEADGRRYPAIEPEFEVNGNLERHADRKFRPYRATHHGFEPAVVHHHMPFGRRVAPPSDKKACAADCGHPACSNGCVGR